MPIPHRSLTLVTRAANSVLTLSEANNWLRLDDGTDDMMIEQLIATATLAAEQYLRRSLLTQTWKLTLDAACGGPNNLPLDGVHELPISALYGTMPRTIHLPKGPLQSVTSLVTYDLTNTPTTFAASNYSVDTAGSRLFLNSGCLWPSSLRLTAAIEITYVTGYGDTPDKLPSPVRTAILIHVASLYEQRGLCADAMDLPAGARQILNQYRILGDRRG